MKGMIRKVLMVVALLSVVLLPACTAGKNHDNIKSHILEYENDSSKLKERGVIFGLDGKLENAEAYNSFLEDVRNGNKTHGDFAARTKEGDWIIFCVEYDGDKFRVVEDPSRDCFGSNPVTEGTYTSIREEEKENLTYVFIEGDEDSVMITYY